MSQYDVFNGDADGICALHQLRLARPCPSILVTGLKRDIALLDRVHAKPGDQVTVLDVSLDRNRAALHRLLASDVAVEYFDHHHAGEVPQHRSLKAVIDTTPGTCTSLLVDRHIAGRHRAWAVVGAFGDNLASVATGLARGIGLDQTAIAVLRQLGEAINYNAYGESEADVLVPPVDLYRMLRDHRDPLAFAEQSPVAAALADRRRRDLARAAEVDPRYVGRGGTIVVLPDVPWARRSLGAYANQLSLGEPDRAHAVLREAEGGTFVASVRAPQTDPRGADALCRRFPGGGGRAAAAGIDRLPADRLAEFACAFDDAFAPSAQ